MSIERFLGLTLFIAGVVGSFLVHPFVGAVGGLGVLILIYDYRLGNKVYRIKDE